MLTDLTYWLHSELQTIIYTDLSITALSTHLSCLCLSLPSLFSTSAFNLSSSSSFSFFHSSLLKIQVTLLNKLPRKSFGSSHYKLHIMGYGITYLAHNSASLLLPSSLLSLLLLLTLKCPTFTISPEFIQMHFSFCQTERAAQGDKGPLPFGKAQKHQSNPSVLEKFKCHLDGRNINVIVQY